jgi:hypothetical protein
VNAAGDPADELVLVALGAPSLAAQAAGSPAQYSLGILFLNFLKIGCVVYGSGYVLLSFLRADFVDRLHWLTDQQLLGALAGVGRHLLIAFN